MSKKRDKNPHNGQHDSDMHTSGPALGAEAGITAAKKKAWFDREGRLRAERNRYFVSNTLLAIGLVASLFALAALAPLKTAVPYLIVQDKIGRSNVVRLSPVQNFTPQEATIRYQLGEFARNVLTYNEGTVTANYEEAWNMTKGIARDQIKDFAEQNNLFAQPGDAKNQREWYRSVEVRTISFANDETALIRLTSTRREDGAATRVRDWLMTVNYTIEPPQTAKQIQQNPIGLYITQWDIQEEG